MHTITVIFVKLKFVSKYTFSNNNNIGIERIPNKGEPVPNSGDWVGGPLHQCQHTYYCLKLSLRKSSFSTFKNALENLCIR